MSGPTTESSHLLPDKRLRSSGEWVVGYLHEVPRIKMAENIPSAAHMFHGVYNGNFAV
jgi:hypothetical protein